VRRDYFRQRFDDLTPRNMDLGRRDSAWSPRAGIVHQPTRSTSLYASYSKSFQPSGDGLSLAANTEDLKPETAENYETGIKHDLLGGRLSTSLAAFRLARNNLRTIDPVDPNRLILVGKQRTEGLEFSISGTVVGGWSVYGGWAWLNTRILRSNDVSSGVPLEGNRAGHIPLNQVTLWSTRFFENGFGFGGGFTHNSNRFTSNDNLVLLPAYSRVDAALFYRTRRYELSANIRNVLNASYYETAHGNFQIYPGAPISGLVTVRYRW
jgi:catecholate siderophore receptor